MRAPQQRLGWIHQLVLMVVLAVASVSWRASAAMTEADCLASGMCLAKVVSDYNYAHCTAGPDLRFSCPTFNDALGPFDSEADFVEKQLAAFTAGYALGNCICQDDGAPGVVEVRPADSPNGEWAQIGDDRQAACTGTTELLPRLFAGTSIESKSNKHFHAGHICGGEFHVLAIPILRRTRSQTCPPGTTLQSWSSSESGCVLDEHIQLQLGMCPSEPAPSTSIGGASKSRSSHLMTSLPVNTATGNKVIVEVDYEGTGPAPLRLVRTYNSSDDVDEAGLGAKWQHNYARALLVFPQGASVSRGDGTTWSFFPRGDGTWVAIGGVRAELRDLSASDPQLPGGWQLVLSNGHVESYDALGRLRVIANAQGLETTLTYDGNGLLQAVMGPFGHTLTLIHNIGRLSKVIDPAGNTIDYAYNNGILTAVTYPHPGGAGAGPRPFRQYHYDDPLYPHHITGLRDERGVLIGQYSYDLLGRARTSGGADIGHGIPQNEHTFTYDDDLKTVIQRPGGVIEERWFENVAGHRVISQTRVNKSAFTTRMRYDDNGRRTQVTDVAKRIDNVDHSTPAVHTRSQASGTTDERAITTAYLSDVVRLPTQITGPSVAPGQSSIQTRSYVDGTKLGEIIESGYHADGTPTSRQTQFHYYKAADGVVHVQGLVKSIDGPRTDVDDRTTYHYHDCDTGGACGRIERLIDAQGHATQFTDYDAHGRVTRTVAPSGLEVFYRYDDRGRLIELSQTSPGETTNTAFFDYDPTGNLIQSQSLTGVVTTYAYDDAGNLERISDGLGGTQTLSYDTRGNLTTTSYEDASGTVTATETRRYDLRDQLMNIDRNGQRSEWSYNEVGELERVRNPRGHDTQFRYDALGRQTQSVDARGGITTVDYDVHDAVVSVTDPEQHTTQFITDDLGNVLREISPARGTLDYIHDTAGNVTAMTDARGVTVQYHYDALNRLLLTDYPIDDDIAFEYDGGTTPNSDNDRGLLTRITQGVDQLIFSHDAYGRVTDDERTIGGSIYRTQYAYDADGRLQSLTYPSGMVVTYHYDAAGQVHRIVATTPSGNLTLLDGIIYKPFGPMTDATTGNGLTLEREFDTRYLPSRIAVTALTGTTALLDRDYLTDASGNITSINDFVEPISSEDFTNGYDELDRLTAAFGRYGERHYQYDAVGHRKRIEYDPTENAFIPKPAIADLTLEYNDEGRIQRALSGATVLGEYRHNAFGQRHTKTAGGTTTHFTYDLAGHLLMEATDLGTLTREYVYHADRLIAVIDHTPTTAAVYWVHTDHLGTPKAMTDASGSVVWQADSAPFGMTSPTVELVTLNVRFPGQYFDWETGGYYNYHRFYDPSTGRYLRSDPIGLHGGLNTYGYAAGNPIAEYDPYGLSSLSALKAALREVHKILGGSLPKGKPGKFGSPQRGDSKKGYRYDSEGHPKSDKLEEQGPHINYWDYTKGKRGRGGISGAVPIKERGGILPELIPSLLIPWWLVPGELGIHPCEMPGGPPCGTPFPGIGSLDPVDDSIYREFCRQNPNAPNCVSSCL